MYWFPDNAVRCDAMLCYAMLFYSIPCYPCLDLQQQIDAMLFYAMVCHATLFSATHIWIYNNRSMQCYGILCYVSLCLSIFPSLSLFPSYLALTFVRSLTLKLLSCPSSLPTNSTELIEEGQHLFLNILYYLSRCKLLSYFVWCHIISYNLFFSFQSNQLIPFSSTWNHMTYSMRY